MAMLAGISQTSGAAAHEKSAVDSELLRLQASDTRDCLTGLAAGILGYQHTMMTAMMVDAPAAPSSPSPARIHADVMTVEDTCAGLGLTTM
jgi:hypothetical protein